MLNPGKVPLEPYMGTRLLTYALYKQPWLLQMVLGW